MHKIKKEILTKALKLVPFDGWTEETLAIAAEKVKKDSKYARIYFPAGIDGLIAFYLEEIDLEMQTKLESQSIKDMRVRDKIKFAVKTRLEILGKNKIAARKAVAYLSMPQHSLTALSTLYKTVDKIWYWAGDDSTDFNFYTKRTLLAAVYSSTLLYWLNDESEGNQETYEFLDRRVENVMQINKAKASLGGMFDTMRSSILGDA